MGIQPSAPTAQDAECPLKSVFVTEILHCSSFLFHKFLHNQKSFIFTVETEKVIKTGFWVEPIL